MKSARDEAELAQLMTKQQQILAAGKEVVTPVAATSVAPVSSSLKFFISLS